MHRVFAAGLFALLAISSAAHAQDAAGCFKDTDCKGSRICVDRTCVEPPAAKSCARDVDCPGDEICEQHLCVPPPAAKKPPKPAKPGKRDLIKEAVRKSAAKPAPAPSAPPDDVPDNAPALANLPAPAKVETAPAPAKVEPPPAPLPVAPPALIQAEPPAPAPAPTPVKTPPPPPKKEPAVEVQPTPAPVVVGPPAPPNELITPPLVVAAPPPPPAEASADEESSSRVVFGIGLTAGLHVWSLNSSETDFGLDLNGDAGIRLSRIFSLEVLAMGGYTPMLASRTGLQGGIGLGVRFDHLAIMPGHILLGGMGSFVAISADNVATINSSGGALLLQYGFPFWGRLEARGQLSYHFLGTIGDPANGAKLSLFTLSLGVAFGR